MSAAPPVCVVWLVLGLGLSIANTNEAAPEGLSWTAPATCPDANAVRAALRRASSDASAGDGVRVDVVSSGGAWRARIDMPTGVRELTGESCQALADAVIVILGLASDERHSLPPAAPEAAAPVVAAPSSAPVIVRDVPSATSAATPAVAKHAPAGVLVGAALLGEVGLLPGPSAGPRLSLLLSDGHWGFELVAAALLPRHAELAGAASPSADIHWLGGQAAVCRMSSALLRVCAGGEIGEVVGTGSGVDRPATARGTWVAFSPQAVLRARLGSWPLSWEAGAGVAWALMRPQLGFDDVGVLHEAAQVSARLWLGLGSN